MIRKIKEMYTKTYGRDVKFYNFSGIMAILRANRVSHQNLLAVIELLESRVYGEVAAVNDAGKPIRVQKQPLGDDWGRASADCAEAGWNVKRVIENDLKQMEMMG